jgi:hypothetical protein
MLNIYFGDMEEAIYNIPPVLILAKNVSLMYL